MTGAGCWHGSVDATPFLSDPRFGPDGNDDCPASGHGQCTRNLNHPGRHMADTGERVIAAWPGTHEPTLADLDDQPGTLTLPDGWEVLCGPGGDYYQRHGGDDEPNIYADEAAGVINGPDAYEPDEARTLAARLVEAAGIVEQLRAGAR